jgi:bifunctional non-homologous end joining protein LigD
MGLKEYKAKRNFKRTKEPAGHVQGARSRRELMFVIQKHAATRLHYDFRLEMEGVLKSWAVPKGVPLTRGDRRLAVQVEDHPIEYSTFEGTIPEGNYGAGTVMVWDRGTYHVKEDDPLQSLREGKLHFFLNGEKLKGEWTLVRMKGSESEDKPQWLLLKSGADLKPLPERTAERSVVTKRSLDEIAADNDRQWQSDRKKEPRRVKSRLLATRRLSASARDITARSGNGTSQRHSPSSETQLASDLQIDRLPLAKAEFMAPMKAALIEHLPKGPEWLYEVKFDGVRALGIKRKGEVSLVSRAAKDLTAKYPEIARVLQKLPVDDTVLDGEVVAVDEQGRSSFQLLQSYHMAGGKKPPLFYYVFDLLVLNGRDLTRQPLLKRKALAESLISRLSPTIRFSPSIKAESNRLMREMQARGLEGLIAKQKESKYEVGRRSGAWAKFKWTNEQEFVIGGYTRPQGARSHFGALLVGYYEKGELLFAAKVGTGFDHKLLTALFKKFQPLVRPNCPFANLPERLTSSRSRGLTASQMKLCTWVEPRLVCQVRFAEWTRDNHLRQPAFLGLREDKDPREVVREKPSG